VALIVDGLADELARLGGNVRVWVCEDQFGNRYRFRSGARPPDIWRPASGGPVPTWAKWIDPTEDTDIYMLEGGE
jgi:hypothetical protein